MKSFKICFFLILSLCGEITFADSCIALKEYDHIAKTVSKNFVDQTFRGLNWPERVAHYRNQLHCSMNEDQIAAVVNQLLAELKTSHTKLFTKNDLDYWALNSIFAKSLNEYSIPFSGIWARKVEGHWIARDVLQGSPAEAAGVRAGDLLLTLDGNEFSPVHWKEGQASLLRFTSDGKNVREVAIRPVRQSLQSAFLKATRLSERIQWVNGRKIGYFHLWCGTRKEFLKAMNESLRRFGRANVDGIILDLRDGFGGAGLEYLQELKQNPSLRNVKTVLLINDGVRSGKEWVSAVFKKDHMGTLVGTTTAGAFTGGAPFRLYNHKYFLYLAVQEFTPEGIGPIEGIGVAPDLEVQGCQRYCNGRDPQLQTALELFL